MKKYDVAIPIFGYIFGEVAAESETEAIDKVRNKAYKSISSLNIDWTEDHSKTIECNEITEDEDEIISFVYSPTKEESMKFIYGNSTDQTLN